MAEETNRDGFMAEKESWEAMRLSPLGKATSLIQGGGGKLSVAGGDPGEPGKQRAS